MLIVGGIFLPTLPLSFSEKGKLGKPKEEIGNLYGFHMNSSNENSHVWIHLIYEFICPMNSSNKNVFPPLSIRVISMGTTLFSSMARLTLP
jgi:hypothetical protein